MTASTPAIKPAENTVDKLWPNKNDEPLQKIAKVAIIVLTLGTILLGAYVLDLVSKLFTKKQVIKKTPKAKPTPVKEDVKKVEAPKAKKPITFETVMNNVHNHIITNKTILSFSLATTIAAMIYFPLTLGVLTYAGLYTSQGDK